MSKQPSSTPKKQKTSTGYEIPIPQRKDFEEILDQVVRQVWAGGGGDSPTGLFVNRPDDEAARGGRSSGRVSNPPLRVGR